ncbi:MAG: ThuA domain-containing protein [Cytophagales bacterium]|nr:ThuA domain-containing protein [Cytophagales bacterium]
MKVSLIAAIIVFFYSCSSSQNKSLDPIPLNESWKEKIFELAPSRASAPVSKKHKVLLFSLFTGFNHWVIPHADVVISTLGEKTGAYDVVKSTDIAMFEQKQLNKFDAIVLNNNCSIGPKRDLFYDALSADSALSEAYKIQKAAELEDNLLAFVKNGGGLAVLHGGIVMQNNSAEVSEMIGGSFDYHPPQQTIELKLADKEHPLTKAFEGTSFTHFDEPYFFKNAYAEKNFRPMLFMEISKIKKMRHETDDKVSYVSWIKRYGKGRVFYVSPSHNAQSYEDARILRYYLNGMQYVVGDLKCDDTPVGQ